MIRMFSTPYKAFVIAFILTAITGLRAIAQPLTADAGSDQTICSNGYIIIGGSTPGMFGTPPYTYSWAPAAAISGSATIANPTANPSVTTTYTLTVTDATSNSTTDAVVITTQPAATVDAGANVSVCSGTASVSLNGTIGGSATSATWSGGNGYFTNPTSLTTIYNPSAADYSAGSVTLTLTTNDPPGACPANYDVVIITFMPGPSINTMPDQSVCQNTLFNFTQTAHAGNTYHWDFGNGDVSSLVNVSYAFSSAGTYNVTFTETNSSGCTSQDVAVFTVNPLPSIFTMSDSTVCAGYTTFSQAYNSGDAFHWDFGNGDTANFNAISFYYNAAGTYNVIYSDTDVHGCTSVATAVYTVKPAPTVAPVVSNASCAGHCDGRIILNAGGGASPYTYTWYGPTGNDTASGLCAGTYSVTIHNSVGCSTTVNRTVGTIPSIVIGTSSPQTICEGDTTLVFSDVMSGGTAPFSYTWDNGSGAMPGMDSMYYAPLSSTSYTITVTDANGCSINGNTTISVTASTNIYGHVNTSSGPLANGTNTAVLYRYMPAYMSFDTVQAVSVNTSGDFVFTAPYHHQYLIEVYADTTPYPNAVPTYYGNSFLWDNAMVLNHGCSANDTANITMVETPVLSGPGSISGTIVEGDSFTRAPGEPIPGIDVKLGHNPGGQMMANTVTNTSGGYQFDNLPLNAPGEYYTIYVDIPGLLRDSTRNVTLDTAQSIVTGQDYIADSNSIYFMDVTTGIVSHSAIANQLGIFPNPSAESTTIQYSIAANAPVALNVYNVLGVKVAALVNTEQNAGTYNYRFNVKEYNLKAGIYFVTLVTNNRTTIRRLVISE